MRGRKHHLFVDTEGFVLKARVHPANETEAAGAKGLLAGLADRFPRMRLIWVDAGYKSGFAAWVKEQLGWTVEEVKHPESGSKGVCVAPGPAPPPAPPKGFRLLKRRWVVERTFAWLGRNRRLSKDYEGLGETEEAWIYLGSARLLLRRLTT